MAEGLSARAGSHRNWLPDLTYPTVSEEKLRELAAAKRTLLGGN